MIVESPGEPPSKAIVNRVVPSNGGDEEGFGSSDGGARLEEILEVGMPKECSREFEIFRLKGLSNSGTSKTSGSAPHLRAARQWILREEKNRNFDDNFAVWNHTPERHT